MAPGRQAMGRDQQDDGVHGHGPQGAPPGSAFGAPTGAAGATGDTGEEAVDAVSGGGAGADGVAPDGQGIDPELLPYLDAADADGTGGDLSLAEVREAGSTLAEAQEAEDAERLEALRHLVANAMLPGISPGALAGSPGDVVGQDGGAGADSARDGEVAALTGELDRLAQLDALLAEVDTDDWADWDSEDAAADGADGAGGAGGADAEQAHRDALAEAAHAVDVSARMRQVEAEILARAPEHQVQPSLERVEAVLDIIGNPERSFQVVHVTGTNGKTSTARMVERLLAETGMRTGRFTSPHLATIRERICLDGEPISEGAFIAAWEDVAPYVAMVDARSAETGGPRMSFFEVLTVMAIAAFADHPVDVAVVEVGMGGRWDATNVVASDVDVITPIGRDHERWLGSSIAEIALEKAGIIKDGATLVSAAQVPEAWAEIAAAAAEHHAVVRRECTEDEDLEDPGAGELAVLDRQLAVGGQLATLRTAAAVYEDVFVPLHGEYQAHNALLALAAAEAVFGGRPLPAGLVESAFTGVTSPGRLEVVRSSPTVLVDAAHNPHGIEALRGAIEEVFPLEHLVAVVGAMADKDVEGILAGLEPLCEAVVCVPIASSTRAMDAEEVAEVAREVFGADRVEVADSLAAGVELAVALAEGHDGPLPASGVLVVGSVVLAAEARALFRRP